MDRRRLAIIKKLNSLAESSEIESKETEGIIDCFAFSQEQLLIGLNHALVITKEECLDSTFLSYEGLSGIVRLDYVDIEYIVAKLDSTLSVMIYSALLWPIQMEFSSQLELISFYRMIESHGKWSINPKVANFPFCPTWVCNSSSGGIPFEVWKEDKFEEPIRNVELFRFPSKEEFRCSVVQRGLRKESRIYGWLVLLDLIPYRNDKDRIAFIYRDLREKFMRYSDQWKSFTEEQLRNNTRQSRLMEQVAKDVPRLRWDEEKPEDGDNIMTDLLLTYATYDADINYSQGMSDLIVAFYFNLNSDPFLTFACFCKFMAKCRTSFQEEGISIVPQLKRLTEWIAVLDPPLAQHLGDSPDTFVFTIPWILVMYRREVSFCQFTRMMDVYLVLGEEFILAFTALIFKKASSTILEKKLKDTDNSNELAIFMLQFVKGIDFEHTFWMAKAITMEIKI